MRTVTAVLLSTAAFFSTLAGGLLALRLARFLTFILAFTAGVLLGVVAFDIIPEAYRLARAQAIDPTVAMVALVLGFLLFHGLEKFLLLHKAHEADYASHHHPQVGVLSALALAGHSFMDGVGIGLAFQVSNTAGVTVAIAVIAHDFCDGLNTVSLMLVHRNTRRRSLAMLLLDAAAPILGRLRRSCSTRRLRFRSPISASSRASCSTSVPRTSCPRLIRAPRRARRSY